MPEQVTIWSRYEWDCPACQDTHSTDVEPEGTVECDGCGEVSEVGETR
jgi:ribosomal protein S27E